MEYCHCGSLGSYIRNGNRLTEEEIREIMACCLYGLVYLHSKNIIHRVGIATAVNRRTSSRTTCSSPRRGSSNSAISVSPKSSTPPLPIAR